MSDDKDRAMRDLYNDEGYDPDELTHPKNVAADDIDDDSVVVAYTTVRNPDPDAPATTWDIVEWEIEDVVPSDDLEDVTDGKVRYPDDTPVTHGVIWGYTNSIPKVQSIGYGDEMYGPDSKFDDPQRWDRQQSHVLGLSDDFVRFDL